MANINTAEPSISLGFMIRALLGRHLTTARSINNKGEGVVTVYRHGRAGQIRESVVFPEADLLRNYGLPCTTKVIA